MRVGLYILLTLSILGTVFLGLRYLPDLLHTVEASAGEPSPGPVLTSHAGATGSGAFLGLDNVRFFWDEKLFVDSERLVVEAIPLPPNQFVDFDNVNAYRLEILNGRVELALSTLQHILNEVVFSYRGPPCAI